ncbi:MAG TPA: hypothetical protein PKW33_03715 [Anaerolineaceae bacterium]|nr:hypothetical protein [Anaerolineaceae bacterium]HPN50669.1 hypothetical protein [Anaerolineaceae bacterium]
MTWETVLNIAAILVFTLVSGWGDAQGFLHSAKVWDQGQFVGREALFSAGGFILGVGAYWVVIRFLQGFGITSPEVQTVGWFVVTMVALALTSGDFFKWPTLDQAVGILLLVGVGWLMFRNHG